MTTKKNYQIRLHARPPGANASAEEKAAFEKDRAAVAAMGSDWRKSSPYADLKQIIPFDAVFDAVYANWKNRLIFLAFINDKPVGMLSAHIANHLGLDYAVASCVQLYVNHQERDGKAVKLLMSAFRDWAEKSGADEIRMPVTSGININKTHAMLVDLMGFESIGGNYAFPLTDKGKKLRDDRQNFQTEK